MRILSVAYPLAPVGPDAVGGAEQILSKLDAALVAAGHRSLVLACEGSRTAGELIPMPKPAGAFTEEARRLAQRQHRQALDALLAREPVDLVHMHGIDFYKYLPAADVPVLVTLHLPLTWYPPGAFAPARPRTWFHCVSQSQARGFAHARDFLPAIENGVSLPLRRAPRRKRNFVVAFGRICPEKGFHVALDAARLAGVPCLLAGRVFPYEAHERYFREEIQPRLDRKRRFIGPVGGVRKRRLLGAARCLLLPTTAPETSSLVAMEAFACGTPVVAFPSGALPEIVEEHRTGFLVRNTDEMAEAIAASQALNPEVCRSVAEQRFSASRMIARYFETYRGLIAKIEEVR